MRVEVIRAMATRLAVPAVAVLAVLGAGGPAAADLSSAPGGEASSGPGGIGATAHIQLTWTGPNRSGGPGSAGGGTVTVRVPVPCFYKQGNTGVGAAQSNDRAHHGEMGRAAQQSYNYERDSWPPDEHTDDPNGHWYYATCEDFPDDWELQRRLDFIDAFYANNENWVWVPDGTLPPEPPVSPDVLMQAAAQAMQDQLTAPALDLNPAAQTTVNLETWAWVPPGAWAPTSVTATAGAVSVTVTATPASLTFGGYPDGSTVKDACTNGGKPYDESSTDCSITFGRSSGRQPGGAYPITGIMTWDITATGAPLQGPPVLTRESEPTPLEVGEVQVPTRWSAQPS